MPEHSIENQSPEHHRVLSSEQLLTEASDRILDWQVDPDFFAYAAETLTMPIDPERGPSAAEIGSSIDYWEAFSEFAARKLHSDESLSEAERQASLLLATTPEYALVQHRLRSETVSAAEKKHFTIIASDFNGNIRRLAELSPDLSVDRLKKELATQSIMLDPTLINSANDVIESAVRGAQHELAVQQILEATEGVTEVEPAAGDDDLKGVDFYVTLEDGTRIAVDAKANQQTVQSLRENKHFIVENNQRPIFALDRYPGRQGPPRLVISSQTATERDLGDRFYIRDQESVRIRAARLAKAFDSAQQLL